MSQRRRRGVPTRLGEGTEEGIELAQAKAEDPAGSEANGEPLLGFPVSHDCWVSPSSHWMGEPALLLAAELWQGAAAGRAIGTNHHRHSWVGPRHRKKRLPLGLETAPILEEYELLLAKQACDLGDAVKRWLLRGGPARASLDARLVGRSSSTAFWMRRATPRCPKQLSRNTAEYVVRGLDADETRAWRHWQRAVSMPCRSTLTATRPASAPPAERSDAWPRHSVGESTRGFTMVGLPREQAQR